MPRNPTYDYRVALCGIGAMLLTVALTIIIRQPWIFFTYPIPFALFGGLWLLQDRSFKNSLLSDSAKAAAELSKIENCSPARAGDRGVEFFSADNRVIVKAFLQLADSSKVPYVANMTQRDGGWLVDDVRCFPGAS